MGRDYAPSPPSVISTGAKWAPPPVISSGANEVSGVEKSYAQISPLRRYAPPVEMTTSGTLCGRFGRDDDARTLRPLTLSKPNLKPSPESASNLRERGHGGVAAAVLEPAEVRCLHAAASSELALREPLFHARLDNLSRDFTLDRLRVPFGPEVLIREGPLQVPSEVTHGAASNLRATALPVLSPEQAFSVSS